MGSIHVAKWNALVLISIFVVVAVLSLVAFGRLPFVPLTASFLILIAVSVQRFVKAKIRVPAVPTPEETKRRAVLAIPPLARIERGRRLVGISLYGSGKIAAYVSVLVDEMPQLTIQIRSATWPRRTLLFQDGLTFDETQAIVDERKIVFVPQSKYSDALWATTVG